MKLFSRTMTHKQAKAIIREVLHLCSDDKLMQIMTDCDSGKMRYTSSCYCFIGVLSSQGVSHTCQNDGGYSEHYASAIDNNLFDRADDAYRILGYDDASNIPPRHEKLANNLTQPRRDSALSKLIREEMAGRGIINADNSCVTEQSEVLR